MNKQSQSFGEIHPVLNAGVNGLSYGAGAAGALMLARALVLALRDRKHEKKINSRKIDEDTIVMTVPKSKMASARDQFTSIESSGSKTVPAGQKCGPREENGRFAPGFCASKSAGWLGDVVVDTEKHIARTGAGILGFMAIAKLARYLEHKRLERQIEAAQQEYVGLMRGERVKDAEYVSDMLMCGENGDALEKSALTQPWPGVAEGGKQLTSAALASLIMTVLSAGYITKKVMDNRFKEEEEPGDDVIPKVNRVVIKTSSDNGIETDPGTVLALVAMFQDSIENGIAKTASDISFIDDIASTKDGRQYILDMFAQSNGLDRDISKSIPNMGLGSKLKHIRTLTDMKRHPGDYKKQVSARVVGLIREKPEDWMPLFHAKENRDLISKLVNDHLGRWGEGTGLWNAIGASGLGRFMKAMAGGLISGTPFGRSFAIRSALSKMGEEKSAQSLPFEQLAALASREKILHDKSNKDLDRKLSEILERLPKRGKKRQGRKITVETADKDSEEFYRKRKADIEKVIGKLER